MALTGLCNAAVVSPVGLAYHGIVFESARIAARRSLAAPRRVITGGKTMIHLLLAAIALFNGESLTGWSPQGDASWAVEENAIVASGAGQGFLLSDAEYANFRLRLEFWIDATTNSGVFIRCMDRKRIHPDSCYELNIWDAHPTQAARTGAIVLHVMPPLAQVQTSNRWNVMEVIASGGHVEVWVNRQLTALLEDAETAGGFIALQHWESGVVRFRNLTLTPLEK
jgi:hypothetical protein